MHFHQRPVSEIYLTLSNLILPFLGIQDQQNIQNPADGTSSGSTIATLYVLPNGTEISETRKSLIIRRAMISPKVGTKD